MEVEDEKKESKKSFVNTVTQKIIAQLETGTVPWQRPWNENKHKPLPYNPISGKRYKGINTLHLIAEAHLKGYTDTRWLTYNQALSMNAQVRGGEKSTLIQYWKFTELRDKLDKEGNPVFDEDGKRVKEEVLLDRPQVFYAHVFNAEQINNMPPIPTKELKWNSIERAETIIKNSGAKIFNDSNSAYYSLRKDEIHLPGKEFFDSNDKYYATVLHELGHWTGAESRLNRDLKHPFGSEGYAKEELRAEIASMIIGDELNIGHDPGQHVAYIESWIKILNDDPKEIFKAAAEAEKIQSYILGFDQIKEQKEEINLNLEQVKNNQNTILESIKKSSEKAPDEYKAIETWANLYNVARENQLSCYLIDDVHGKEADSRIIYVDKHNNILPIYTELSHGNGKAVTYINDERVKGTGFTSVLDWQKDALNNAIKEFNMKNDINKENITWLNISYQEKDVVKTIAGKLENGEAAIEWDKNKKQWYAKPGADLEKLKPWISTDSISNNATTATEMKITWLNISYQEKDIVKTIAGKLENGEAAIEWDKNKKQWYAKPGADLEKLKPWISTDSISNNATTATATTTTTTTTDTATTDTEKVILAIPYSQKDIVKKIAGRLENGEAAIEWDKINKVWVAKPGADLEKLKPWIPDNLNNTQTELHPRDEFALALQSMGCIVDGEHPIMDGQNHRIKTEGDKKGQVAGFYKAFLDGHPAGYIKNNRTGQEMKWKAKGYNLSDEEKAKLAAEAAIRKEERAKEQAEQYEKVADHISSKFAELPSLTRSTPYLERKGIDVYPGLATDEENKITYIPAYDSNGKQWSTQYIKEDGEKRFEKGSKKTGCFHVVGGQEALKNAPAIIIAEGYATAATITKVIGYSTVSAFDSGNLKSVAKSLSEMFPNKPIIIAGDDDLRLEEKQGINPGRSKAIDAANSVSGVAIFPTFAPGENKKLTDFNDLVNQSKLGKDAGERQIKVAIENGIIKALQQQQKQQQQQQQIKQRKNTNNISLPKL